MDRGRIAGVDALLEVEERWLLGKEEVYLCSKQRKGVCLEQARCAFAWEDRMAAHLFAFICSHVSRTSTYGHRRLEYNRSRPISQI